MTTTTVSSGGVTAPGQPITAGNGVDVLNGGTVLTAMVQSGSVATNSAGAMPVLSGAPVGTASAGLIIEVGGTDSGSTIQAGGVELVLGSATGDTVSGLQFVSGSGTVAGVATFASVSNETVVSGGVVDLFLAGDTATNVTVQGGTLNISGRATASNTTLSGGTLTLLSPKATLAGSLVFAGPATLAVSAVAAPVSAGISFGDQAIISGFGQGDVIDDTVVSGGYTFATNAAGNYVATLTGTSAGSSVSQTFTFTGATAGHLVQSIDAGGGEALSYVACYCPGTLILTDHGEVAVEDLAVGDLVVTASGGQRPIVWLGHRTLPCHTHPNRRAVLPVRISAHALGHNKPRRDLFVSPGHAIAVDVLGEVLIPAATLVNGTTIQQVEMDQVTYWHVELGSHDLLLADNLAAESYLDMGNRSFFGESGVVTLDALPDGDPAARTPADFCRPFHSEGPLVTVVRSQLRRRALDAGWTLDGSDPFAGLHLVIDGVRTEPACRGLVARFSVPAGAQDVWLVSSTVRPCEVRDEADSRDLGVCLRRLTVDDGFGVPQEIALDDPLLGTGLHAPEDGVRRWTAGPARLPAALWPHAPDGFFLRVELNGPALPRWVAPSDAGRRSVRVPVAGGPEPVALAG